MKVEYKSPLVRLGNEKEVNYWIQIVIYIN